MKPPSPEIVKAALSLPIEAKRALIKQGGPGRWVNKRGIDLYGALDQPEKATQHLNAGWTWLPCSEVAWMRAAYGDEWERILPHVALPTTPIERVYRGVFQGVTFTDTDPVKCALKAWGVL